MIPLRHLSRVYGRGVASTLPIPAAVPLLHCPDIYLLFLPLVPRPCYFPSRPRFPEIRPPSRLSSSVTSDFIFIRATDSDPVTPDCGACVTLTGTLLFLHTFPSPPPLPLPPPSPRPARIRTEALLPPRLTNISVRAFPCVRGFSSKSDFQLL